MEHKGMMHWHAEAGYPQWRVEKKIRWRIVQISICADVIFLGTSIACKANGTLELAHHGFKRAITAAKLSS